MDFKAEVSVCRFCPPGRSAECHVMVKVTMPGLPFETQYEELAGAYEQALSEMDTPMSPVFERYFISDAAAQQKVLESRLSDRKCAVSIIEQPPLNGTKIAMLAVLQQDAVTEREGDSLFSVRRGSFTHLYSAGMRNSSGRGSEAQTKELLVGYGETLGEKGGCLADNCVRTWFFVQNIDVNYAGVVSARNEVFSSQGLGNDTHFIASTGIGGRTADRNELVSMDAYSVMGLLPGQVHYLYAPTHMNRTSEYGVSFERGAVVTYGDRSHVFISGTASIDNRGQVLYPNDIRRQTERMLENVGKLLEEEMCSFDNVMHIIVYLRDIADAGVVNRIFSERFSDKPYVVLYAPVCRPGWLIEMECMAIRGNRDCRFPDF